MKRAVVLSRNFVLLNASSISWVVRAHMLPIFTTFGLHYPRSLVHQRAVFPILCNVIVSNMAADDRVGRAHAIYPFVMIHLIVNDSRNFYTNKADNPIYLQYFWCKYSIVISHEKHKTADFPCRHINQSLILLCFIIVRNMTADT